MNALAYPAIVLDPALRVVAANKSIQLLLGADLVGTEFVRAIRHPDVLDCLVQAVETNQPVSSEIELTVATRRSYAIHAAHLGHEQDAPILFTMMDITAKRDAEASRSIFVANVSHELRSPLTTLKGVVETLQTSARDDEEARDHFLNLMDGEIGRMSRLVQDLLLLAKKEAKEHVRPSAAVDLVGILRDTVALVIASSPDYSGRVDFQCQSPLPKILADADELIDVFRNLIENALRYSTPGSIVQISVSAQAASVAREPDRVLVRIKDQGEGIAPEHIPRLTERFYRVDTGRSRQMGGTGLGLAIVKHVLNRHRARLSIASVVGKGSEVSVRFRAAPNP